eukprot:TRINITY_DN27633_c0_g1_i1.p1 TRINITY_DN27633_c0_g1~~TRINITY_DN27633_c0_g1_i1.p1  ORF type:complete len:421 (-),score=80.11 TRINITY_DN27633_c0_g1_i1:176-1438(-)
MLMFVVKSVLLFQVTLAWQKPADAGRKIQDASEPVHFFSIGDWGQQPHQIFPPNGGSMHNSCDHQPQAKRCQKDSDEWNREESAQRNVMEQMLQVAKNQSISWVVNVGDNFYFDGVASTWHWHWRTSFEEMYADKVFHVPWLSVLGNHDYGGDCCAKDLFGGAHGALSLLGVGDAHPTAQFDYDSEKTWTWPDSKKSRWVMPYFNWTKVMDLGPYKVQFFAIDSNVADMTKQCLRCGGCTNSGQHPEVLKRGCPAGTGDQCQCFFERLFHDQLDWLELELKASQRDGQIVWRFVIQHHPWNFINGPSGERLLALLETYKVQVVFAGHVHSMRHDIIQHTTAMVMTGSSGGYQYDGGTAPAGSTVGNTIWSSNFLDYGFAHLEMTKQQLKVTYINDQGKRLKSLTIDATPTARVQESRVVV